MFLDAFDDQEFRESENGSKHINELRRRSSGAPAGARHVFSAWSSTGGRASLATG